MAHPGCLSLISSKSGYISSRLATSSAASEPKERCYLLEFYCRSGITGYCLAERGLHIFISFVLLRGYR